MGMTGKTAGARCRGRDILVSTSGADEVGMKVEINQHRLERADTRGFAAPGAGQVRLAAMAALGRTWITDVWSVATRGARLDGVALASVGSLARGDAGPLSDFDLVLLHDGRSLSVKEVTALADRIWYPIWDCGAKLDHSVRTVGQCRTVAAADLSAAGALLAPELVGLVGGGGAGLVLATVGKLLANDVAPRLRSGAPPP